jgi:Cd2+/Zn2+-exporting ATPase
MNRMQHRLVADWADRRLLAIHRAISIFTAAIKRRNAPQWGGAPAAELKTGSPSGPPIAAAIRTAFCAVLIVAGWVLRPAPASTASFIGAYLAGGAGPIATMLTALYRRQVSVDLLMIVAALGAAYLGDWAEGAVLLFLFSLSGTLETYAFYRTRRSIESLIQLRPQEATRVRKGEEVRVAIASLLPEDTVRVRPGERIPVDGEVIEGDTSVDESTLTGESRAVSKTAGSPVFAGTLNGSGSVLVRMTRAVADTTLERIIRMVHEAQAEKTPTQKFVESWQQPYVFCVLAGSILTFLGARLIHTQDWNDAFYHAMVLLVVASPCAVVVGTPAAVLSAIARAARRGVLFKGGHHLELLGQVEIVAFDKTGTITEGKPGITAVWTPSEQETEPFLRLVAAVEQRSEHHLAAAILDEVRRRGLMVPPVQDFESHTGLGVHGRVEGRWVGVGREGLFALHDVAVPPEVLKSAQHFRGEGQTALLGVVDGVSGGVIALADRPRSDAAAALATLKHIGIRRNIILTGDHERVAQAVADAVGADEVRAGLLPDQKVLELRGLMKDGRPLAMVGDGVNDAPVLAAAPVGIAMGGAGSDVALEVSDVVLMRDDLMSLPFAVWLSRRTCKRIRESMALAFGVIGFLVLFSFLGLPLWLGVIGHEGSTLLVVLNGLRLLWEEPPTPSSPG